MNPQIKNMQNSRKTYKVIELFIHPQFENSQRNRPSPVEVRQLTPGCPTLPRPQRLGGFALRGRKFRNNPFV
jgi:hypothetical protein